MDKNIKLPCFKQTKQKYMQRKCHGKAILKTSQKMNRKKHK